MLFLLCGLSFFSSFLFYLSSLFESLNIIFLFSPSLSLPRSRSMHRAYHGILSFLFLFLSFSFSLFSLGSFSFHEPDALVSFLFDLLAAGLRTHASTYLADGCVAWLGRPAGTRPIEHSNTSTIDDLCI